MTKIRVELRERSYDIFIGVSLANLGKAIKNVSFLKNLPLPRKALILTQSFSKKNYCKILSQSLSSAGILSVFSFIGEGEKVKNLKTVELLYKKCLQEKLDRTSFLIAFGGGVVGDIAGFVAATYLRGIPFIQVPTTLLSMVDSAIGGKVGVDLPEAKNYVGSIYQPILVWIDPTVVKTLPEREFTNGLAEVIKYGVIADKKLFEMLEKNSFSSQEVTLQHLPTLISRCAKIKARVVSRDEREREGLREILNFGHTLGHAIESVTQYKDYSHGEAISIGMCAASAIARKLSLWQEENQQRLTNLLQKMGLPLLLKKKLSEKKIAEALIRDKKVQAGELRYVLPVRIGKVIVQKIPLKLALEGLKAVQPKPLSSSGI